MKMPNQTTTRRDPELTQRGVEGGCWGPPMPPTLLNVNVEIALEFMHSLTHSGIHSGIR